MKKLQEAQTEKLIFDHKIKNLEYFIDLQEMVIKRIKKVIEESKKQPDLINDVILSHDHITTFHIKALTNLGYMNFWLEKCLKEYELHLQIDEEDKKDEKLTCRKKTRKLNTLENNMMECILKEQNKS